MGIKRKIAVEDFVLGVLFAVFPFFSMPLVIFQVWRRKRFFYFLLLAIFFGLVASTSVPTGDLFRQYRDYFQVMNFSFSEFYSGRTETLDFIIPFSIFAFAKVGIGMHWLSFIVVTGFYSVVFWFFLKVSKSNKDLEGNLIMYSSIILILFFLNDFMTYALKLRSPLGQLFIFLFFAKLIFDNNKKYSLLVLSIMSHFSSIIVLPILIVRKLFSKRQVQKIFLFSLLIMPFTKGIIIFLFNLSQPILEFYPEFNRRISFYIVGFWSGSYMEELSTNALIRHYLGVIVYLIGMLFYWSKSSKKDSSLLLYFTAVNILFSFPNVFNRFFAVPLLLAVITLARDYKKGDLRKMNFAIPYALLFTLAFMFSSVNFLAQRRPLKISNINEVFYKNVFQIMGHKYDKKWINERMNEKGLIKGDENDSKEK